jgi:hypothetical protein
MQDVTMRGNYGADSSLDYSWPGSASLCGLMPGFIGVAVPVYVYVLAAPVE